MKSRSMRVAAAAAVGAALFALLQLALSQAHAGPPQPPPDGRFRWIPELEALMPRELPNQLSQPLDRQRLQAQLSRRLADIPVPDPPFAVDFVHYPTPEEVATFLQQLEDAYPSLVEVTEIGRSWQDRPIFAVRIANAAAGDPDTRPALYVDGQHHAREAVGAQTVLYFAWYLASQYGSDPLVTHLLDTRTVYAVPSVNPDGNEIFLQSDQRQRKTANPQASDDDADGLFDEDGREGADYGTYDVYHYEFDPEWVALHSGDPFAPGWGNHLLRQTYLGIFDGAGNEIVQQDDDADGNLNEDPPGGVDANRNYASHWEQGNDNPTTAIYSGPAPFSEPETRAVRDFVVAHPNVALASSFHSGADVLLYPWGWSADAELPDRFWYELLSRKGSQLTEVDGFHGAPHTWTARGLYAGSGSTMDWLYERGILAWTPEIYGASSLSFSQRITTTGVFTVGLSVGEAFNPPPAEIPLTADRWLRWNLYLLAATPDVGLSSVGIDAGTLMLTVANDGLLPLDVEAVVHVDRQVYSTTISSLSSAERAWSVPLSNPAFTGPATITLTARSDVGIGAGPAQVEVVGLEVQEGTVAVVEGRLESLVEMGGFFDGWFAGRRWDKPGEYHLGPALLQERFLPFVGRDIIAHRGD